VMALAQMLNVGAVERWSAVLDRDDVVDVRPQFPASRLLAPRSFLLDLPA